MAILSGVFLAVFLCTGSAVAAPAGVTIEPPTIMVGDRRASFPIDFSQNSAFFKLLITLPLP